MGRSIDSALIMENWIKRENRKKTGIPRAKIILLVLLFIAIGLYGSRFYPAIFKLKSYVGALSETKTLASEQDIQAAIENILDELRLAKAGIERPALNYINQQVEYPIFRVLWPNDFPFIWFTDRVQRQSQKYSGLHYQAVEVGGGKNLLVYFLVPGLSDTLTEIQLISSSKVQPEISSIAFIFDDFADFKIQDALELIWLDIPFGFILSPDQIPASKLAKALRASQGQCILKVPADRESWILVVKAHKLAGIVRNTDLNEVNIRAVFGAFPMLDAFYFSDMEDQDRELVKLIVDQAENLRLSYIHQNQKVGYADSLAYIKGMKIKELTGVTTCLEMSKDEIRKLIVHNANDFLKRDKGIYLIASRTGNTEVIKSQQPIFKKLNIVQVKPLRMANIVDNL